jgi:pSer/pThr/pTyr-binding forkhead associated (FHA) protein
MMMQRAFSVGTDTQQVWALLQLKCPLLEKKQAVEPPPPQQRVEEPKPVEIAREVREQAPPPAVGWSGMGQAQAQSAPSETAEEKAREIPSRYCLTLKEGDHRIALATSGQILLGRFDPSSPTNPDVDLSYDDRGSRIISRRHARVIGHEGLHLIEDMGSTNGTMINGERLRVGQKVVLQPGDRVTLGSHEFLYKSIAEVQTPSGAALPAYLWVTFTGRRFSLPSWGEVIVGRGDPVVGFRPDVDLGEEEEVAQVVARRHVKISARDGRHYVEDLGSANGTRLNGSRIGIGERGLLEPGDHLWLGGCVLAYDVEL